jgi:hypothetical protein
MTVETKTMLAIRIQRALAFASEQDATGPLAALAEVLAGAARVGLVWARCRNALLPFDAGTIEHLLADERSFHADDVQRATHVLSLCATPEGPGEMGVVLVNVRPTAGIGAAPGLVFSASLAAEAFDTDADSLRGLLDTCVDAVAPDLAMIGPSAYVRELGVGWATFARRVRRELLPAGARLIPTGSGSLVIAHTEAPGSESASACQAMLRTRDAVHGEMVPAPSPEAVATFTASPGGAPARAPMVALAQPSYLSPGPVPVRGAPPDLAGTSLDVQLGLGPALPFDPSKAPAPPQPQVPRVPPAGVSSVDFHLGLASGRGRPPPQAPRAPSEVASTSLDVQLGRGPVLPFDASKAPAPPQPQVPRAPSALTGTVDLQLGRDVARFAALAAQQSVSAGRSPSPAEPVPPLTLEQYAQFRARLMVDGEDDPQTWKAFGVSSKADKEALQARFAAQFRQDPAAQARFVELIPRLVGELRSPGRKS